MNRTVDGAGIWNDEDGFYYDVIHVSERGTHSAQDSVAGRPDSVICRANPRPGLLERVPNVTRRIHGTSTIVPKLTSQIACLRPEGLQERQLLAIVDERRLKRILKIMLDENEFLSPYAFAASRKYHRDHHSPGS